jgi:hypothetical protein
LNERLATPTASLSSIDIDADARTVAVDHTIVIGRTVPISRSVSVNLTAVDDIIINVAGVGVTAHAASAIERAVGTTKIATRGSSK